MIAATDLAEYLAEIREEVCGRCVERRPGGPPCTPLGKTCGVELHLPELIDAIHEVQSGSIAPYLESTHRGVCENCPQHHGSQCPCPMDYLMVLVVQAVETVDLRRLESGRSSLLPPGPEEGAFNPDLVHRAYDVAVGTWTGCDWPTEFGKSRLDLNGWTAADAQTMALTHVGTLRGDDWKAAAEWLRRVEAHSDEAAIEAALAVAEADAGNWPSAHSHANRAWALEVATGRPLRRGQPPTWQRLQQVLKAVAQPEVAAGSSVT